MAAMKPRTGDGPLEVTKEGRGIVMRVPLEGGGRLVVEMTPDEATALGEALRAAVGWPDTPRFRPVAMRLGGSTARPCRSTRGLVSRCVAVRALVPGLWDSPQPGFGGPIRA